jgi:hypothetical protein
VCRRNGEPWLAQPPFQVLVLADLIGVFAGNGKPEGIEDRYLSNRRSGDLIHPTLKIDSSRSNGKS